MFAKTIVLSDAFLDLPLSARCLYFTLGMLADDDGFVSNPRRVMRSYGIADDNMKILIAKKFVLVLKKDECSIVLIKHWRMHNTIQRDRYTPSPYHDLLKYIYLDENNAYSLNAGEGKRPALTGEKASDSNVFPFCIQDVYTDKVSIDKDSIGKDSIDNNSSLLEEKQEKEDPKIAKAREIINKYYGGSK